MIDLFPAVFIFYSIGTTSLSRKGMQRRAAVKFSVENCFKRVRIRCARRFSCNFSVENCFIVPYLMAQHEY